MWRYISVLEKQRRSYEIGIGKFRLYHAAPLGYARVGECHHGAFPTGTEQRHCCCYASAYHDCFGSVGKKYRFCEFAEVFAEFVPECDGFLVAGVGFLREFGTGGVVSVAEPQAAAVMLEV